MYVLVYCITDNIAVTLHRKKLQISDMKKTLVCEVALV